MARVVAAVLLGTLVLCCVSGHIPVQSQESASEVRESDSRDDQPVRPDSIQDAEALAAVHQFGQAEALLRRILPRAEAEFGALSAEVGYVLDRLVMCLWRGGKSQADETIALADRAIALKEEIHGSDHPEVAISLFNLGVIRAIGGDLVGAEPIFAQVLAIREAHLPAGDADIAAAINALANIKYHSSDFAGALPLYRRSLAMAEESSGALDPRAVSIRANLANTLIELGNYTEAQSILELQITLLEGEGLEIEDLAFSYSLRAKILTLIGDFEEELPLRYRSLEIRAALYPELHPRIAESKLNLGVALWKVGRLSEGQPLIEEALSIWVQLYGEEQVHIGAFHEILGRIAFDQGDLAEARAQHEKALALRETGLGTDAPKVAEVLQSLGRIAVAEGRYDEARARLDRAINIVSERISAEHIWIASYNLDLAQAEFLSGEYAAAAERALAADRRYREHLRRTSRALPERQALQYAREGRVCTDLLLTLVDRIPGAEMTTRVWDAVIRSRALILDEMAARNRRGYRGSDPELDLLVEEYQRASTGFANLHVRGPQDADPQVYGKRLEESRRAMENAERALARASIATGRQETGRRDLGWSDVDRALPDGSALVAYVRYQHHLGRETRPTYRVFVCAPGSRDPEWVDLGAAAAIDARIADWKREISLGALHKDRTREEAHRAYAEAGAALREALWDPLAQYCAGADRVFVVPDGQVHLVNLASLPDDDGGYLVEGPATFHHLSAERELAGLGEAAPETGGALVLGAPDFDGTDLIAEALPGAAPATFRGEQTDCLELGSLRFEPLPGCLQEAREVASRWEVRLAEDRDTDWRSPTQTPPRVHLLTGGEASETALKRMAPGNRILHIATHGFFLNGECPSGLEETRGIGLLIPEAASNAGDVPAAGREIRNPLLLSGLALAGANRREEVGPGDEDGILTAQEIATLDLSATRWAVLSACETGTGEVMNGEGVLGLQRAFRIAGARTLITSLWSVEDDAARRWMQAFYAASGDRALNTADAVRDANLTMLRERRQQGEDTHPFYWAAFVASGDWR